MVTLNRKKVVLGLSGGVDSTVAVLILKDQGYEVTGLYMDVFGKDSSDEQSLYNIKRAETAAGQLGIDFIYKDVRKEFEKIVVQNFCSEYRCARTPNPCIVCNPGIKFRVLCEAADRIGAYHVATGHYATVHHDEDSDIWFIGKAGNIRKDQSYMLYRLGQDVISRLILPLGDVDDKEYVRSIARKNMMKNSEAKDSQEICFITGGDTYKDFLRERGITVPAGNFTDKEGNVLGEHTGILNYTIGQRKGLGITLGKPAFVTSIDSETNTVVLGSSEDLFSREVCSEDNVIADESMLDADDITVKIRYAAKPAPAVLELMADGKIKIVFKDPQRAATPGQSVVFYRDDLVIGGGFISDRKGENVK